MKEKILNIYLIINDGNVVSFKAVVYETEGSDDEKINFLKSRVNNDYQTATDFEAPMNKWGKYMPYKKFARLEQYGKQYHLFEEIFSTYDVPAKPLVCVTPVVDGKILSESN